jgi:hypothetical protein
MLITNYTQFAKKTFFLGMDRVYFIILLLFLSLFLVLLIILDYNILPFIFISMVIFIISIISFKRTPYWFEKFVIKTSLKQKYKHTLKKNNLILGR